MKRALALALALVSAACSSSSDQSDVTVVNVPPQPKGSVTGHVQDARGAPVAAAQVHLAASSLAADAVTDAEGRYAFTGVPGESTVSVTVRADGYATATARGFVPGSSGGDVVDGGSTHIEHVLFHLGGSVVLQVVGYDGASPSSAVATADFDLPGAALTVAGAYAAGTLTFSPTPEILDLQRGGYGVTVAVEDPDGRYAGKALFLSGDDLAGAAIPVIALDAAGGSAALAIQATNVGNLLAPSLQAAESLVPAPGPVTVVYNRRLLQPPAILVTDAFGSFVAANAVSALGGYGFHVVPAQPFEAGHRYDFWYRATAEGSIPVESDTRAASFFADLPAGGLPLSVAVTWADGDANGLVDLGETVRLEFNQSLGDGATTGGQVPFYLDDPAAPECTAAVPCFAVVSETSSGPATGFSTRFTFQWGSLVSLAPNPAGFPAVSLVVDLANQWKWAGCPWGPFCGLQIQDVEARVLGNTAAYANPSSTFAPDP